MKEREICELVAKIYAKKDYLSLTSMERHLVQLLEEAKCITATEFGFVGKPLK